MTATHCVRVSEVSLSLLNLKRDHATLKRTSVSGAAATAEHKPSSPLFSSTSATILAQDGKAKTPRPNMLSPIVERVLSTSGDTRNTP